ncbi:hypothetical protein BH23BAC2_BH23BAC2_23430 [soil metagenome]
MNYGVKEIDLALNYIKEEKENSIPQDSFQEATLIELEKYKLIERRPNGKYVITEKGSYAKQLGAFRYIEMKKSENYFSNYSTQKYNDNKKLIDYAFLLAMMLLLILFVFMKDDFFIKL